MKWIRNILVALGLLTSFGAVVGQDISIRQEVYKLQNGKYEYIAPNTLKKGVTVNEYQAPTGYGYQVVEEEIRKDGLYQRSYGNGPESMERSYDWKKISDYTNATTTL